jgi:Late exocytosis, associated with Golgi transport
MKTNRRKPHRLPTGFWSWFLPVYRTTEEEVIEVAGMDACMYMRIMSFGALLSLIQLCSRKTSERG